MSVGEHGDMNGLDPAQMADAEAKKREAEGASASETSPKKKGSGK